MIGLLMAALQVTDPSAGEPASWSDWQRFAYRQNGFGDTPYLYDGSSRRREGDVVSVWVTFDFHYSGRNPTTHVELWQIDCARRRSRAGDSFLLDGANVSRPRRAGGAFAPISVGSVEAALADRICNRD